MLAACLKVRLKTEMALPLELVTARQSSSPEFGVIGVKNNGLLWGTVCPIISHHFLATWRDISDYLS